VGAAGERLFPNKVPHDPANMNEARELADRTDGIPIGLFFRDEGKQRYDEYSTEGLAMPRATKVAALNAELDKYAV